MIAELVIGLFGGLTVGVLVLAYWVNKERKERKDREG